MCIKTVISGLFRWKTLFLILTVFVVLSIGYVIILLNRIDSSLDSEFTSNSYQPIPTDMNEISAIEGNAEIKIPTRARNVYAFTTGFQDIDIFVRLEIEPKELSIFMQNTLCNKPLEEIDPLLQKNGIMGLSWWEPSNSKRLMSCTVMKEISQYQYIRQIILIDMTNPELYIIYIETSNS